jgi:predicted nucleic acid-binding protein
LQLLGTGRFEPLISPPLCLEYEDVLRRREVLPHLTETDARDFIDYFVSQSIECRIHFLWRPFLPDPKDDLVLELALAGAARFILTHNLKHFGKAMSLGIDAVTPRAFLDILKPQ